MMGDHSAPNQVPDVIGWLTPARRKIIYSVVVAIAPILAVRGIVSHDELTLWLNLAAAVLIGSGGTVALAHTPPKPRE